LKPKFSPWGLLKETKNYFGQVITEPIVWLTPNEPYQEVDREILSNEDIERIIRAHQVGILKADGLDIYNPFGLDKKETSWIRPEQKQITPKERIEMVQQVSRTIKLEENAKAKIKEDLNLGLERQAESFVNRKANIIRKDLKAVIGKDLNLPFLIKCRDVELREKNRKSVLSLLVELIETGIAGITTDRCIDKSTGYTDLDMLYSQMIVEEFDESEED
jgi:hypothetical protein